jgi:hypothetical protein
MSSKLKYEYVNFLARPDDGTGCVYFRGQKIIENAAGMTWSGGELLVSTTAGDKRVVFAADGTVAVEDVGSAPNRQVNSSLAQQVSEYLGAAQGESR